MASFKFHRWDSALKKCTEAKRKGGAEAQANRWRGDPLLLNAEAHELPPEKQREALDMAEEAPPELRAKIAPVWKYCFAQWHIYDAGLEAIEKGISLREGLQDEDLLKDVDTLNKLMENGELEQAKTAEKWTWKLLAPMPPSGSIEPWNEATAAPVLKVGRAERREGVNAFAQEHYTKALWHFWQGLTLVARAPAGAVGAHAKLRGDLYKNKAAAAAKLGMGRMALGASLAALALDPEDPKAWYRKSQALTALGRDEEAQQALSKAGLGGQPAPPAGLGVALRDDGLPGMAEEVELDVMKQELLESLTFFDLGVDSIAAVDLVRHLKAEIPSVRIPLTFVYDFPTVRAAVSELLGAINGDETVLRGKMCGSVCRALRQVLGVDPVQASLDGRLGPKSPQAEFQEEEAMAILADLQKVYEENSWVQTARSVAKRVAFDQRAFLVGLKAPALEAQRKVLEARGFEPSAEGMQRLESAVVRAAKDSEQVRNLLQAVRVAQQGGPNGMWAVNMEPDGSEQADDGHRMQCLSQYVRGDPFGPLRGSSATSDLLVA